MRSVLEYAGFTYPSDVAVGVGVCGNAAAVNALARVSATEKYMVIRRDLFALIWWVEVYITGEIDGVAWKGVALIAVTRRSMRALSMLPLYYVNFTGQRLKVI